MRLTSHRVTVRDIAAKAGVSISTVHLVLANKPGPKTETRARVLETAQLLNYQYNSVAGSLKRGVMRVAAVLPALTNNNLYYYTPIWEGIRAYCKMVKDFNIELVEFPYYNHGLATMPVEAIDQIKSEENLSGLLLLGDIQPETKIALQAVSDLGMPIVLVNSDATGVKRICCVQSDNYMIGRLMGEIIYRQTRLGGTLLVCAGDVNTPANIESVNGLETYFSQYDATKTIHKTYYSDGGISLYYRLIDQLKQHDDITCACSVTARGSVQLANAIVDSGKSNLIVAIGSDVFQKNLDSLRRGTFVTIISKNPFQQGYTAMEALFNYIIRNTPPEQDMFYVKCEAIFQSTISLYE